VSAGGADLLGGPGGPGGMVKPLSPLYNGMMICAMATARWRGCDVSTIRSWRKLCLADCGRSCAEKG